MIGIEDEEDFEALLDEFSPSGEILKEKEPKDGPGKRISEIINSYPGVQTELDLHEHTGEEAKRLIENFIVNAHHKRTRTLRVITGKGIHSAEGKSVLRQVAEDKLSDLKKRNIVLHFKWEQGKMAKSGAIIVYLY